ncbi:cellulose synthase subunit BcsC [Posidoniimonas polymericola]|uniref:Cellulose synthase subunit BcsC n=1 Tax=Posidoniimonas polymericola TaxID=2528002 RepID=A0A5C5YL26_9BACT|nr:cellulose synthase subunit BcsC [Posidoniimonas polymericola]
MRHLFALGYRDPEQERKQAVEQRERRRTAMAEIERRAASGEITQAKEAAAALLLQSPDDLELNLRVAKLFYALGEMRLALPCLDTLMHSGVETPNVVHLRGAVLLGMRQLPMAAEQLEYARHLEPSRPELHAQLGWAYLRVGAAQQAEEAFRRELATNPRSYSALHGMAAALCRRSAFEQSAEHALDAIEQRPGDWRTHYRLGVALVQLGRTDDAAGAFQAAVRLDQRCLAPLRWLAECLAEGSRGRQACQDETRRRLATRRAQRIPGGGDQRADGPARSARPHQQ